MSSACATIDDCSLHQLPRISDGRGSLSFVEAADHVPFHIARLFYMYAFPAGTRRGGHAHRECAQFLIALEGSFDVQLQDATGERTISLDRPDVGLHIPPGIWVTVLSVTQPAVIVALASAPYEETDYIRDFASFRRWKHDQQAPPPSHSDRILLRPYKAADAPAFAASAQASVATVGRWLSWCRPDFTEKRASQYIRRTQADQASRIAYSYGIYSNDAPGRHLGGVALNRIDWQSRCANLGYWVASHSTGKGIGSAAAALMCRHGFEALGLRRIEIQVAVGNEPSKRVACGLGARLEGVLRGKCVQAGEPVDTELYGLLKDDFVAAAR